MYLVGRNFYAKFLPQVRELAGKEAAEEIISQHVTALEPHHWLNDPQVTNPILGLGDFAREDDG
jgi:hypothetical protein